MGPRIIHLYTILCATAPWGFSASALTRPRGFRHNGRSGPCEEGTPLRRPAAAEGRPRAVAVYVHSSARSVSFNLEQQPLWLGFTFSAWSSSVRLTTRLSVTTSCEWWANSTNYCPERRQSSERYFPNQGSISRPAFVAATRTVVHGKSFNRTMYPASSLSWKTCFHTTSQYLFWKPYLILTKGQFTSPDELPTERPAARSDWGLLFSTFVARYDLKGSNASCSYLCQRASWTKRFTVWHGLAMA